MASIVAKTVILDTSADWESWLYVIKTMSINDERDTWEFIDLALPQEPRLPKRPTMPEATDLGKQSIADLDVDERELFKLMYQQYREVLTQVTKTLETITRIRNFIVSTVSAKNIVYIKKTSTVYQMLVALKKRLAPTDDAKKIQLANQYNKLKRFQKNEPIE